MGVQKASKKYVRRRKVSVSVIVSNKNKWNELKGVGYVQQFIVESTSRRVKESELESKREG